MEEEMDKLIVNIVVSSFFEVIPLNKAVFIFWLLLIICGWLGSMYYILSRIIKTWRMRRRR